MRLAILLEHLGLQTIEASYACARCSVLLNAIGRW